MSLPRISNNGPKRRRLSVEVYFVLYLSAIILLLGTSPSEKQYDAQLEEAIAQLINTDFEVDVEKPALLIPILPASLNVDTLAGRLPRDTINIVRAHGSFEKVEFRIVGIEDTVTGNALPVEQGRLKKETDSSVSFHWDQGDKTTSAVYVVSVEAEAQPIIPPQISSPQARSRVERVIAERALMKDTAHFSISVIPATSDEYLLAIRNAPTLTSDGSPDDAVSRLDELFSLIAEPPGSAGFRAIPNRDALNAPPGGTWKNRVSIFGVSRTSNIRVSGTPGVRISSAGANYLDLVGPAPSTGQKKVRVSLNAPNGGSVIVSFVVNARDLDDVRIPQVMYAGETYSLDFSSDGVDINLLSVSVIENGRTDIQNHSPILEYTPKANSGQVVFQRYVDGKFYDSKPATLRSLPKPTITIGEKRGNGVLIETVTYGTINGRDNTAVCRVASGNAEDPELVDTQINWFTRHIRMIWKIEPKDPSQRLAFKLHVWDQRGQKHSREELNYEDL